MFGSGLDRLLVADTRSVGVAASSHVLGDEEASFAELSVVDGLVSAVDLVDQIVVGDVSHVIQDYVVNPITVFRCLLATRRGDASVPR